MGDKGERSREAAEGARTTSSTITGELQAGALNGACDTRFAKRRSGGYSFCSFSSFVENIHL
jgi:hypothetical protein